MQANPFSTLPIDLLRTTDGKLCILDWGMVTRLPPELQLTLIEHMAHLTSSDYAEIPRDLLLLGFIPEDKANLIDDSGIVEVLADIYGAWTSGGGVAAINVNEVVNQLQDLTAKKGNLFQVRQYDGLSNTVSPQRLTIAFSTRRFRLTLLILQSLFLFLKELGYRMIPNIVSLTNACHTSVTDS